jgi:hypothetical protein
VRSAAAAGALEVPAEVRDAVAGVPEIGALDQVFMLLTVDVQGRVDVCLLSRTEVEATASSLRVVVAGTKARRNLRVTGRATFVAVAGDAAYYLALRVVRVLEEAGAIGAVLEVERALRDGLGVELHPACFRVEEKLAAEERWDRTRRLLERLVSEDVDL